MRGKIDLWKDNKGFGFIVPDDGSERVFFHISTVKCQGRRPQIGDFVIYKATRDSQNRLKAQAVRIEDPATYSNTQYKRKATTIDPPQKNIFDYSLIFVLLVSLATFSFVLFKSQRFEDAFPSGIPALVAIFLLNRQKKPKEKTFSCSRCNKIAEHDARTIKAWNNGFLKLYCGSCHREWHMNKPAQVVRSNLSRPGGCLGVLIILTLIPILAGVGLYQWRS